MVCACIVCRMRFLYVCMHGMRVRRALLVYGPSGYLWIGERYVGRGKLMYWVVWSFRRGVYAV